MGSVGGGPGMAKCIRESLGKCPWGGQPVLGNCLGNAPRVVSGIGKLLGKWPLRMVFMTRLLFYFTYLNRLKNEEVTFSIRGQDHTEDEPGTAGPPLKRLPLPLQLDPPPPFSRKEKRFQPILLLMD